MEGVGQTSVLSITDVTVLDKGQGQFPVKSFFRVRFRSVIIKIKSCKFLFIGQ